MKKILLVVSVLFFTVTFAQDKSFEANITKLMYAKNGMGAVENITTKLAKNISESKKIEFSNKLNNLKTEFIENTINQFKSDYTYTQINKIYTEFHSDKINFTDQTFDFFSKFRKLKGEFSKEAKELYYQYR